MGMNELLILRSINSETNTSKKVKFIARLYGSIALIKGIETSTGFSKYSYTFGPCDIELKNIKFREAISFLIPSGEFVEADILKIKIDSESMNYAIKGDICNVISSISWKSKTTDTIKIQGTFSEREQFDKMIDDMLINKIEGINIRDFEISTGEKALSNCLREIGYIFEKHSFCLTELRDSMNLFLMSMGIDQKLKINESSIYNRDGGDLEVYRNNMPEKLESLNKEELFSILKKLEENPLVLAGIKEKIIQLIVRNGNDKMVG